MPAWASGCKRHKRVCRPDAAEYGALPARAGTALLRHLPGREPGRRRAAADRALVVLQRAQPAGVAPAAVRAPRRPRLSLRRRAVPLDGAGRHRGAAGDRARRRRDAARRDGADRAGHRPARHAAGRAAAVPAHAALPGRAEGTRGGGPRLRDAAAAAGDGLRAPSLHARRLQSPRTRGKRATEITIASIGRLEKLLDEAAPEAAAARRACRSTSRSTASRPTRPTSCSACRSPARPRT